MTDEQSLHVVRPGVEQVRRFDIEQMQQHGREAHLAGKAYQACLLLKESISGIEDAAIVDASVVESLVQSWENRLVNALAELDARYQNLWGRRVEIAAHSELVQEEFNANERLVTVRRFHPVADRFSGFDVKSTDGLCLVLGLGETQFFPLYDIEDIEERYI